jgi:hypothetical protein
MRLLAVAEDGNLYPYFREQGSVLLPAGKTLDTFLAGAGSGSLVVYDSQLSLSSAGASPGGMMTSLGVAPVVQDISVSGSNNDAEESTSGSVNLTSTDLELINDAGTNQTVGIRFAGVNVPPGATIERAYVQFTVDENQTGTPVTVTIQGQKIGNAPVFTTTSGNVSSRLRTTAQVSWASIPPWPTADIGLAGPNQQTPELRTIIQEIVDQTGPGGWVSGNALVVIITGSNGNIRRTAVSADGTAGQQARLHLEWSVPAALLSQPVTTTTTTTGPSTTTTTTTLPANTTTMYQAGVSGPTNSANIDTYIRRSSATSNFGSSSSLYVGVTDGSTKAHRTLIEFNVSDIPVGATVTACTLTVYVSDRTSPTAGTLSTLCRPHWLDGNSQGESQATWNRFKSGSNWTTAGAGSTAPCGAGAAGSGGAGGDYTSTGSVAYTPPASTGFFTFPDITALCQDAVSAQNRHLRLRIAQNSEAAMNQFFRFSSSDTGTTSRRPKLTVTWAVGGSTTTTTATTTTTTTGAPTTSTTGTGTTTSTTATTITVTTTTSTTNPGPATTSVFQHGVSGPANTANIDTKMRMGQATTNFGSDPELHVGVTNGADKIYRTIMAFDLSSIPSTATVTACTLRINVTQRTNPTAGRITRLCGGSHWLDGNGQSESQATWNVSKTGTNWQQAGAGLAGTCGAGADYTSTGQVTYTPPGGTGLFTFPDVKTLCQDAITNQSGWLRLRIKQDSESTQSNLIMFDSSDAGTASNRPRLSVTWTN